MAKCSSCPAGIVWAKSPTGANLPLDEEPVDVGALIDEATRAGKRRPTFYWLDRSPQDDTLHAFRYEPDGSEREGELYVSHFTTCPNARQFSGRGRA